MNRREFCGGMIGAGAALVAGDLDPSTDQPVPEHKVELIYRDGAGRELSRIDLSADVVMIAHPPDGWSTFQSVVTTTGDWYGHGIMVSGVRL